MTLLSLGCVVISGSWLPREHTFFDAFETIALYDRARLKRVCCSPMCTTR